ncbi:hypothetical protein [Aquimarina sp. AU474]|uniref:hypothetical protein n=1 Tax=Aquimarina sp. AU474 TaxID=2108529 RepID=UPI001356B8D9|nr:hypothetical protein [Aquimarina sp. AU474]
MKKQVNNIINLKKLTIARINPGMMCKIQGGECNPTDEDMGTHESFCMGCGPTTNRY